MTKTKTTSKTYIVVVRDFGPGGSGVSVVVHRLGCSCPSVYDLQTVVHRARVEAHEDVDKRAGVIAREFGLAWFDFSISDCALF